MPVRADRVVVAVRNFVDEILGYQVSAPNAHGLPPFDRHFGHDDRGAGTKGGRRNPTVLPDESRAPRKRRILKTGAIDNLPRSGALSGEEEHQYPGENRTQ